MTCLEFCLDCGLGFESVEEWWEHIAGCSDDRLGLEADERRIAKEGA